MLKKQTVKTWQVACKPPPDQNVWEWARDNVDFSLVGNYDTPLKTKYDPNFMPFWKEPVEAVTDPTVSEIVALKCARAGGSENLLMNPIRFMVGVRPIPTLYVTGDQMGAEAMMEERIKRGLRAATTTRQKLRRAFATQHRIAFEDMDLFITWPRSRQAFKQRGYGLVLCDEVSTWPEFSADMARKRTASYPFAHIVFISSPDPQQKRSSADDPIFIEYKRGDQRKWHCADPATGKPFVFELGGGSGPGLRWDEHAKDDDGNWDLDRVAKTAHYITPGGAKLTEADRMAVVRAGRWIPTNPAAPANVRSYHVTAFMTPFDSFGGIAVAFLKAKREGKMALRTFLYEYMAHEWFDDIEKVYDNQLERRDGGYLRGTNPLGEHEDHTILMTVDVQKDHLWYLLRSWRPGGESALIDWGRCLDWDDVDEIAAKYRPAWLAVDSGYGQRTQEVYEESLRRQYIPMKGDDKAKPGLLPFSRTAINPYEGTRRQIEGQSVLLTVFHSDTFKLMLLDRMRGDVQGWQIYRGIERDYLRQMTAEERTPTGWVKRRPDNHCFDLETMQLVLAMQQGYLLPIGEATA